MITDIFTYLFVISIILFTYFLHSYVEREKSRKYLRLQISNSENDI